MFPVILDHFAIFAFIVLLFVAAVGDARHFHISNRLCFGLLGLYVLHVFASPQPVDWAGGVVVFAAVLGLGLVAFRFELLGGGDVKLLSAAALWAGPQWLLHLLLLTAVSGGVLALAALAFPVVARQGRQRFTPMKHTVFKREIPYGIAIALGGAYVGAQLLLG